MSPARDAVRLACLTVLGSGYMRPAGATWSSLLSTLLFGGLWLLLAAAGAHRVVLETVVLVAIAVASALSIRWGTWATLRFKAGDPKSFTLDEFAGQWLSLLVLPIGLAAPADVLAYHLGLQFLLFRFFDILKIPPARQAERLPAGWGILMDDLFAGVYANLAGQLLWRYTALAAWLGI